MYAYYSRHNHKDGTLPARIAAGPGGKPYQIMCIPIPSIGKYINTHTMACTQVLQSKKVLYYYISKSFMGSITVLSALSVTYIYIIGIQYSYTIQLYNIVILGCIYNIFILITALIAIGVLFFVSLDWWLRTVGVLLVFYWCSIGVCLLYSTIA